MKYTLKFKPGEYDTPLSGIRTAKISGRDIIQIMDMSSELDGNSFAAFQTIISSPDSENSNQILKHRLINNNLFSDIMITDEFVKDPGSSTDVPLWYSHTLNKAVYTTTVTTKEIRRKIRQDKLETDRKIYGLIPSTGSYIIPRGSVSISYGSTNIDPDNYIVNYHTGEITIKESALTGVASIVIRYKLITNEINIDEIGSAYYGFSAVPLDKNYHFFNIRILSNSKNSFTVRYMSKTSDTVFEVLEKTSYLQLFTRVENIPDTILPDTKRMFYYNSSDIYVPSTNADHLYCFMPKYIRNNKISAAEPVNCSFTSPWYPIITNGNVENPYGEYSSDSSNRTLLIRERAQVLSTTMINVSNSRIIFARSANDTVSGISVVRDYDNALIPVKHVDSYTGNIELGINIAKHDIITVSYRIPAEGKEIPISTNPMDFYSTTGINTREYGIVICVVDSRMLPPGRKNNIYYKTLNMFYAGRPRSYSYHYINDELNNRDYTRRNEFREDMNLPPLFYSEDNLYRIEPIGLIYVNSTLDSDAFDIIDLRTYGGGTSNFNYSFHDYARYDGENTDLSSFLRITIPSWVKENLKARCLEWSPTVAISDSKNDAAEAEAEKIIRTKIKKFSLLGTEQEVIFGD